MSTSSPSSGPAQAPPVFTRSLILAALLIFVIPLLSLGIFTWADSKNDAMLVSEVEKSAQKDKTLTPEERKAAVEFYRRHPLSEMIAAATPEGEQMRAMFPEMTGRYTTFRWARYGALLCLITALAALIPLRIMLLRARRAHEVWQCLRAGWWILRSLVVVQVIVQAALVVLLSYWVTALVMNVYSVKLVVVAGVVALLAVGALLKATFSRLPREQPVEGRELTDAEAPAIWERVREVARRLGTAPPDRIIAGVDAQFFVTAHPLTLGGRELSGRSLYVSLPLLEKMTVWEADAVLGHEMAHFAGEDTEFSLRVTPLLQRWDLYLHHLYFGPGRPVFHFMYVFQCLYLKVLSDHSRIRELRADRTGAAMANAAAMAGALVKIVAYARWRDTSESGLLEQNRRAENLDLRQQVEHGFPGALRSFVSDPTVLKKVTPHPFDTHPPLRDRLTALGLDPAVVLRDPALFQPAQQSWYHAIIGAAQVEAALWKDYQTALEDFQLTLLAHRTVPQNDEEEALLQKAFPPLMFKKGPKTAVLEHDRLHITGWPWPVFFGDIKTLTEDLGMTGMYIKITRHYRGGKQEKPLTFTPKQFRDAAGRDMREPFKKYYMRFLAASAWQEAQAQLPQPPAQQHLQPQPQVAVPV